VLTVSEDREQTRRIHQLQRSRQTLEGLLQRQDRDEILKVHQNAQRLLKPLLVANPYAPELTFLDSQIRTRRDHMKYLTLIRSIALLHQHQRPTKTVQHNGKGLQYIEVTRKDIEIANRLAHEVLGRSLDELPPQTRRLLGLLDQMVAEECQKLGMDRSDYRFTRRQVRENTGWGNTQLRIHLERLVDMEYLVVHHGSRGQSFEYELVYDGQGQDEKPFMTGLIDVESLDQCQYDKNLAGSGAGLAGQKAELAGPKRGQNGPKTGGWRGIENSPDPHEYSLGSRSGQKSAETALEGLKNPIVSYVPISEPSYLNPSFPLAAKEKTSEGL
jgi:hypothetical protein